MFIDKMHNHEMHLSRFLNTKKVKKLYYYYYGLFATTTYVVVCRNSSTKVFCYIQISMEVVENKTVIRKIRLGISIKPLAICNRF